MRILGTILWSVGYAIETLLSIVLLWPLNAYAWSKHLSPNTDNFKGRLCSIGLWGSALLGTTLTIPLTAIFMHVSMNALTAAVWIALLAVYILVTARYLRLLGKVDNLFSHQHQSWRGVIRRFRWLHSPFRRKNVPLGEFGQPLC